MNTGRYYERNQYNPWRFIKGYAINEREMREINKVYCDDWLNNGLPDKCAKLIIADPPYYKVKGEFDFIWETFDDYLADVEKWAIECKRVLADNGTLFWYGDRKNIAYSQVIFDKYFNLESNITVHIYDRQTNKIQPEDARCFINVTERLLMYSNETIRTGLEVIKLDVNNFIPLRDYFRDYKKALGISKKQIIDIVGQSADHCFRSDSTQWDMPTYETYKSLEQFPIKHEFIRKEYEFIRKEYEELRKEYEELRKEYEELRRYFNPTEEYKLDVIRVSQEGHITGEYDHETVKPETLTRILINTTTRKGDLVVIPFAGSGTECAMSAYEGRPFYGFDTKQKYVDMSNTRTAKIFKEPQLF